MSTNSKPPATARVVTPRFMGKKARLIYEAIGRQGWGPWHHHRSLLAKQIARPMFPADEHSIKSSGRGLGDRVMQLHPADSAVDQVRPWGVTCTRGRWRWISQDDMAAISIDLAEQIKRDGDGDYNLTNSVKQLTTEDGDPRCGHALRVLRAIGVRESMHIDYMFEIARNVARLLIEAGKVKP